jgi:CRISPR-associated protein Cmr2
VKQFMLMFSLGPVQAFIAQARKTRDLWLGSFLLSKLMEAAMEGIDKQGTFVFPTDPKIDGWIPDLPNKYIAIFDTSEVAQEAACQSERQTKLRWETICKQIGRKILKEHYTTETEVNTTTQASKIWQRQTNFCSFFEVFWVVVAGSEDHYSQWLKATQSAHDARKRLRNFLVQDEPGEKSTISGEREALHDDGTSRKAVQKFWENLTEHLSAKDISKDGSERLDAIDTIKRFALNSSELKQSSKVQKRKLDEIVFPSTSSIATAPFVKKLLQSEIPEMVLKQWDQITYPELSYSSYPNDIPYLQEFEREKHEGKWSWLLLRDGDCYFPEAFTPCYLKENYGMIFDREEQKESNLVLKDKAFIQSCLDALKDLRRAVGSQPTPYYALVQMDGDKMGTLLSGVEDIGQHQSISSALSTFARKEVPRIVQKEHPGRLVYAGGDDVLAFTPLHGMLDMVDKLQKQYGEEIREKIRKEDREKVTASMGIAIAHHFTPLSVVRRAASDAEKLAKNRYGRNALVVTILRRSGEQTRVGCHWCYTNPDIKPIELFKKFYQYFVSDQLSPKSIHILLDEATALVGLEKDAQISEIKRVLKRQSNDQKTTDGEEKKLPALDELAKQVVQLGCAMDEENLKNAKKEHLSTELHADVLRRGLVEVFGWLLVMAFLAREGLEG